jgi:predicted RNase H-like HicB family nuclease
MIIYWSNEDSVFVVQVPELLGCAAHGDTQELALKNANEATQLWIGAAKEFRDPIPEPKRQRLMLAWDRPLPLKLLAAPDNHQKSPPQPRRNP